ncbi:MAG: hypothetical protein KAX49_18540 [Halanaerobiales bacterium]|nr:hypothetical protein [Halanaerobiales bacterium]
MNPLIGRFYEVKFWGSKAEQTVSKLEIIVTYPNENEYVANHIIVKGDATELTIDGVPIELTDGSFEVEKQLSVKRNKPDKDTMIIEVVNSTGLSDRVELTVNMNQPPQVEITSPLDLFGTNEETIVLITKPFPLSGKLITQKYH